MSSVVILLDLLVAFNPINHSLVHTHESCNSCQSIAMVYFSPWWIVISGDMERIHTCSMQILHWSPTRLSSGSYFVLPLDPLSRWNHILTWVFLPLLSWWHSTHSLLHHPVLWHPCFCMNLCMSGRDLIRDDMPSAETKSQQDWIAVCPRRTISMSRSYGLMV